MGAVMVVGGGFAGCAAALAAAKQDAAVMLAERTDMLLGTGLVGGIFRNNGRLTATLEAEALGCGELFAVMERSARHRNIDFPGHAHAWLYDVTVVEPLVRRLLVDSGVKVFLGTRIIDVVLREDRLLAAVTQEGEQVFADAFVDATGTAGGMGNCVRFGNGCAMCIMRCPAFGPRVSLAARAGVMEIMGLHAGGRPGSMSGSCKINKDSLARELRLVLEAQGVLVIPLPQALWRGEWQAKACQQYNLPAFRENLILLDTGHAKLMAPFFPLAELRKVPGLEHARYEDPYAGGVGNSIRFTAVTPRDNRLKVEGLENLFCAGEKAGFLVGHTEAVVTGSLAGYNAATLALGGELLALPESLACGDIIAYANVARGGEQDRSSRITFSGAAYFSRLKSLGLYPAGREEVEKRVEITGLAGIFRGRKKVDLSNI